MSIRVGVISDTHNLLRPAAKAFLAGCDLILHGGDICAPAVLEDLSVIAPVIAVRGNNDVGAWAQELDESEMVTVGDVFVYIIHDLSQMDINLAGAGISVVVSGHSHRPKVEQRDGVLFVNPGSAGPRRFSLPISIGEIVIDGASVSARLAEIAA